MNPPRLPNTEGPREAGAVSAPVEDAPAERPAAPREPARRGDFNSPSLARGVPSFARPRAATSESAAASAAAALTGTETTATPPTRPIAQSVRANRSTWDQICEWIARIVTTIPTLLADVARTLFAYVGEILAAPLRLLIEGPLWLYEQLTGRSTAAARAAISGAIRGAFATVLGVVEGVLRVPAGIIGAAINFTRDLLSLRWTREPMRLADAFLALPLTALATALSPLFFGLRRLDDTVHPPRALNAAERARMSYDFPADVLDRVRVHPPSSWVYGLFGSASIAQTIGDDVYVRTDPPAARTMSHELVHVLQYAATPGAEAGFLGQYFARLINRGIATGDMMRAYEALDEETEAYGLERDEQRQ